MAATERRQQFADIKKKVRRSLTVDEGGRLLDVCGPHRLFYTVGLWTGLRVNEVRLLEWRDLTLDGDRFCIRLLAETTKAKRADELPLHPDLADALLEAGPPFARPTDPVLGFVPTLKTFKRDLDRAGIALEDDPGPHGRAARTADHVHIVAGVVRRGAEGADRPGPAHPAGSAP